MSDFHKRKEAARADVKLVFSQRSLDEWKRAREAEIRKKYQDASTAVCKQWADEAERRAREKLKAEADVLAKAATNKAFVLMLGLSVQALHERFGFREKRIEKFTNAVLEFNEEFQNNDMSIADFYRMLWDRYGVTFAELSAPGTPEREEEIEKHISWLEEGQGKGRDEEDKNAGGSGGGGSGDDGRRDDGGGARVQRGSGKRDKGRPDGA